MKGRLVIKNHKYYAVIEYKEDNGKRKAIWINTHLDERGNKKKAKEILDAELDKLLGNAPAITEETQPTQIVEPVKIVKKESAVIKESITQRNNGKTYYTECD